MASNACFKSVFKSSISSIPTDIRIKLSEIPSLFLSSTGTDAWVIIAGCSIKLSTPPKLSANVKSESCFKNLFDSESPP